MNENYCTWISLTEEGRGGVVKGGRRRSLFAFPFERFGPLL